MPSASGPTTVGNTSVPIVAPLRVTLSAGPAKPSHVQSRARSIVNATIQWSKSSAAVGESQRAAVGRQRSAQRARGGEDGAGAGRAGQCQPGRGQAKGLRDQRRQIAARLQPTGAQLLRRHKREQIRLARRLFAHDIIGDEAVRRGRRAVIIALDRRQRRQADADVARRRDRQGRRIVGRRRHRRDVRHIGVGERQGERGIGAGGEILDDRIDDSPLHPVEIARQGSGGAGVVVGDRGFDGDAEAVDIGIGNAERTAAGLGLRDQRIERGTLKRRRADAGKERLGIADARPANRELGDRSDRGGLCRQRRRRRVSSPLRAPWAGYSAGTGRSRLAPSPDAPDCRPGPARRRSGRPAGCESRSRRHSAAASAGPAAAHLPASGSCRG